MRIGQKVTQIKDFKWPAKQGEETPQFGVVYTIRAIVENTFGVFLRFYEIRNAERAYHDFTGEMDFSAQWFRPVVDRPTDITVFEEALSGPLREAVKD